MKKIKEAPKPTYDEYNAHCASKYFKRRPEIVITKGYEIEATIWEIGYGEFFYGPGKEKITAKTGCYMGTISDIYKDGKYTFLLCDPLQPPSHKPRRIELQHENISLLLVLAYKTHRDMLRKKANAA